ncbi:MAG: LptF/LptG family permease, partial [Calditrichia bacterium]
MFILARYIIKEHLGPFLFSLAVIMFVFVTKFIVQYIGKIFGKGLSLFTILEIVYLNLAWMLALAVPMAVLVAALMAFGRLSADNEITILKSSGIGLYKIIRPAIILAILLTLAMFWFNDRVLPEYNHRARLLFTSISRKKPTLQLEEGIFINLDKFSILVQEVDRPMGKEMAESTDITAPHYNSDAADRLRDITIFDRSASNLQRTIIAERGQLVFDPETERLIFTLYNGEIHEVNTDDYSEYRRLQFTRNDFFIPAPDLVFKRSEDEWRGDREMSIKMMREEVRNFRRSVESEKEMIRNTLRFYLPAPDSLLPAFTAAAGSQKEPKILNFRQQQLIRSRALRKTQAM